MFDISSDQNFVLLECDTGNQCIHVCYRNALHLKLSDKQSEYSCGAFFESSDFDDVTNTCDRLRLCCRSRSLLDSDVKFADCKNRNP